MKYLSPAIDGTIRSRYAAFVRNLHPLVFSIWIAAHTTTLSLILGRILVQSGVLNNRASVEAPAAMDAISGILISPIVETLVLQSLVILLLAKLTSNRFVIVPITTVLFAAAHLSNGLQSALINISLGFFLATTYLFWWRKSGRHRVAIDTTLLVHVLHNAFWWAMRFVPASWLL